MGAVYLFIVISAQWRQKQAPVRRGTVRWRHCYLYAGTTNPRC